MVAEDCMQGASHLLVAFLKVSQLFKIKAGYWLQDTTGFFCQVEICIDEEKQINRS